MPRHSHGRPGLRRAALVAILSLSPVAGGCSSGSGGADGSGAHANYGEDVRRPAEPADGAPVALVPFRIGGAPDVYVEFKAFNYRDTGVTSFAGEVDLLDAEGNVLATQPFSFEGTPVVGPGDDAIMRISEGVPPTTAAATFRVQRATLVDLDEWTAAGASAAPSPPALPTTVPTDGPTDGPTDAAPSEGTGAAAMPAALEGTGAVAPDATAPASGEGTGASAPIPAAPTAPVDPAEPAAPAAEPGSGP